MPAQAASAAASGSTQMLRYAVDAEAMNRMVSEYVARKKDDVRTQVRASCTPQ
jgi:hypothetical protein